MKTCFHCHAAQPLAAFAHSPNSRSPDKLGILCASCRARLSPKDKARLETAFWRANQAALKQSGARSSQDQNLARALELWTQQNGQCAVCSDPLQKETMCLHRPRSSGQARGLLCPACNRAMKSLRDDPALFQKAAVYLLPPKD